VVNIFERRVRFVRSADPFPILIYRATSQQPAAMEVPMKGSQLTVFADNQSHRKARMTLVEWILTQVTKAGIEGATVIEVSESIDVHGKYHAERFFELVDQPVVVTVAADDARIDALLDDLRRGGVRLFYTRCPVEYEVLGMDEPIFGEQP
jgi:PII-like signaling protein